MKTILGNALIVLKEYQKEVAPSAVIALVVLFVMFRGGIGFFCDYQSRQEHVIP